MPNPMTSIISSVAQQYELINELDESLVEGKTRISSDLSILLRRNIRTKLLIVRFSLTNNDVVDDDDTQVIIDSQRI